MVLLHVEILQAKLFIMFRLFLTFIFLFEKSRSWFWATFVTCNFGLDQTEMSKSPD